MAQKYVKNTVTGVTSAGVSPVLDVVGQTGYSVVATIENASSLTMDVQLEGALNEDGPWAPIPSTQATKTTNQSFIYDTPITGIRFIRVARTSVSGRCDFSVEMLGVDVK